MPSQLCTIICALILPPVAVWIVDGCSVCVLLNMILVCCGFIPGVIHACYMVFRLELANSLGKGISTGGGTST